MTSFLVTFLKGQGKGNDNRVVRTALNRERLIDFSHRLRDSSSNVIICDYSVEDDDLEIQTDGSSKVVAD